MKHNLTNKPKLYKIPSDVTGHLNFEVEVIEWFEGFEKELRANLAWVRSMQKTCVKKDVPMFLWEESVYREVLGEDKQEVKRK